MPKHRAVAWQAVPVLLAVLIVGFHFATNFRQATAQPSPGWSRPKSLQNGDLTGALAPVTLESGDSLLLASTPAGVTWVRVAADGTATGQGTLALESGVHAALSAVGAGNQVDLFWLDNAAGPGTLYQARVDAAGQVVVPPVAVAAKVTAFVARQGSKGPAVVAYGAEGLQLYAPARGGWASLGKPAAIAGTFGSVDAQVLSGDAILAVVHTDMGENQQQLLAVRGTLQAGLQPAVPIYHFETQAVPGKVSAHVRQIALGVDKEYGYLVYAVETTGRDMRDIAMNTITGRLDDPASWHVVALDATGRLSDQVRVSQLFTALAVPGQSDRAQFILEVLANSRYTTDFGLVAVSYQGGNRVGADLVSEGKGAFRPAVAPGPAGTLIAFASDVTSGGQRLYAVSSGPDFIARQQHVTFADMTQALVDTMFDLFSIFFPLATGLFWFVPTMAAVGALYLAALTWAEHNPRTAFWIGVAVAVPIMLWVGLVKFTTPTYTTRMPNWMAQPFMPALLYLALSGIMLAVTLQVRRPGKGSGAFAALTYWGVTTMLLGGLLFGPFAR